MTVPALLFVCLLVCLIFRFPNSFPTTPQNFQTSDFFHSSIHLLHETHHHMYSNQRLLPRNALFFSLWLGLIGGLFCFCFVLTFFVLVETFFSFSFWVPSVKKVEWCISIVLCFWASDNGTHHPHTSFNASPFNLQKLDLESYGHSSATSLSLSSSLRFINPARRPEMDFPLLHVSYITENRQFTITNHYYVGVLWWKLFFIWKNKITTQFASFYLKKILLILWSLPCNNLFFVLCCWFFVGW